MLAQSLANVIERADTELTIFMSIGHVCWCHAHRERFRQNAGLWSLTHLQQK